MTADSDLLIFGAGDQDSNNQSSKKAKTAEPELPKEDKPKSLGIFNVPKRTEPMLISYKEPPKIDMSIFKESKESAATPGKKYERLSARISKEKARGKMCVWHPWREAYAMCTYCNRPFCFEDTVEFNNSYYCLEDIDNVTSKYERKLTTLESGMSTLAGILLIISVLVFFYFAYGQAASVIKSISNSGIQAFMGSANSNFFIFLEIIFVILGFASAIMVFLQSSKGMYLGIFSCLAMVILFSYQLLTQGTIYYGILDAIVFVSFVMFVQSKATNVNSDRRLKSETSITKSNITKWPNAGKF
jgi:hypothetical protein